MRNLNQEMVWKEEDEVGGNPYEYVQMFSDKTATSLESIQLVACTLQAVLKNLT